MKGASPTFFSIAMSDSKTASCGGSRAPSEDFVAVYDFVGMLGKRFKCLIDKNIIWYKRCPTNHKGAKRGQA